MSTRWESRSATAGAVVALTLVLWAAMAPIASAKTPPTPAAVTTIGAEESEEPSFERDGMRISRLTGVPLAIYGPSVELAPADPETMARQYLSDHRELLHLRHEDLSDLAHRHTWASPLGHTVRFDQEVSGVPVYKGEIAITIDHQNRVIFVANGYKPGVPATMGAPALSAEEARTRARNHLQVSGAVDHEETRLVLYPTAGEWRLAYRVALVPSTSPVGDWEIIADASTGEILKAVDNAHYVDGAGNIFDPDPLSSAGATYGDPGYVDGNDANTPQLQAELVNAVLRDITLNAGTYTLKGPWAEIIDFESPFYGLFSEASPTWNYNRFDNAFEAALVYWHIDNIMRWVNITLGLNIHPFQYPGGVQFDPHGLSGADNSHYIGSTGRVAFGEGGVDDSEDADVVIHELGHGLHDWVTNGSLSQVNGLSEGFGDYIAASYSRSLGQWLPNQPAYHYVFSWDGHNPFWAGRVTNYGATYPGGLVGQIHTDGQIWSTCLMRIWDAIGREKTDKACLAGLGMTNSSSSQNDAANAMLQAAIALNYSQSELSAMVSNFQQTGYSVGTPANIVAAPLVFNFSLPPNGTSTQQLTIENQTDPLFGADLTWSITDIEPLPFTNGNSVVVAAQGGTSYPDLDLAKGEADPRLGPPTASDFGGPDAFGYVWIDSNDPGGPVFDWQDITGVGTAITLTDDGSISIPLPFTFPFYGQNKTSVLLSANGYMTFGTSGGVYTNSGIPNSGAPNDLIAGFWDDLNPALGGTIHRYHDAVGNRFIVQFTNIQHFGGSAPYTFQMILTPDGDILCQYLTMSGPLTEATIGIENPAGTVGLQVVFNGPYVQNNLALLFTRLGECPWLSENPTSGTVPPQSSQVIDITADATGLTPGTYNCDLILTSNDPDQGSLTIPVTLVVNAGSAVEDQAASPQRFQLHANRPNPFNPMTTIRYELPTAETVRLAIYDTSGRLVRVLVDGARQEAGVHTASWDGRDALGKDLASGVYYYRVNAGSFSATRSAVLMR